MDSMALKGKNLQYFSGRADNSVLLRGVVKDLIGEGFSRGTLVKWAVEAGYSQGYVSSLSSQILVSLGLRERKHGGGRKPSLAALELLAYARSRYGADFLKILHAAIRAAAIPFKCARPGRMGCITFCCKTIM
jgi:hypothetical protein